MNESAQPTGSLPVHGAMNGRLLVQGLYMLVSTSLHACYAYLPCWSGNCPVDNWVDEKVNCDRLIHPCINC